MCCRRPLASLSIPNAFQLQFLSNAHYLQTENDLGRALTLRSAHTTTHRVPCGRFG